MSITLGEVRAHGSASVANDVVMRIAGFIVAASTGRRYGDWRQVRVASAVGASGAARATAACSVLLNYQANSASYTQRATMLCGWGLGSKFLKAGWLIPYVWVAGKTVCSFALEMSMAPIKYNVYFTRQSKLSLP